MKSEQMPQPESEKALQLLGSLQDGQQVFSTPHSHHHDNPELADLLPQALEQIDSAERTFFVASVDFGKPIGASRCVETAADDEIVYAQREGRQGLTRFVKNKDSSPTSFVTVVAKKIPEGYELVTAFVGPQAEREPWDTNIADESERARSKTFWESHAMVWGTEKIIPDTETS